MFDLIFKTVVVVCTAVIVLALLWASILQPLIILLIIPACLVAWLVWAISRIPVANGVPHA